MITLIELRVFTKWLRNKIEKMTTDFGGRQPGSQRRRLNCKRLAHQSLEDRCALDGALGHFVRAGGDADAVTSDLVSAGAENLAKLEMDNDEIYAQTQVTLQIDNDFGFAFRRAKAAGLIPIIIGGSIVVPQTAADSIDQITAIDDARSWARNGANATADYEYVAEPGSPSDLVFHAHLFIAGGALPVTSGGAYFDTGDLKVSAFVNDYNIAATFRTDGTSDGTWELSGYLPSGEVQGNVDGVNLHFVFEIPIADGGGVVLDSRNQHDGLEIQSFFGGFGQMVASTASGAWGYVTADGEDVPPGDFNYDGVVDGQDYEIWTDGKPQADGNLDGKIDKLDYAIWAANADAILVTTSVDENNGTGNVSLREAIALAADSSHPGHDIIAFHGSLLGQTITLSSSPFWLTIGNTNEVSILGPGADQLTINANGKLAAFIVQGGGSTPITSTISNLKITGATAAFGAASAINHNDSNGNHDLILKNLEIIGNKYGVNHVANGELSITESNIAQNSATGIFHAGSTLSTGKLTISNSTIRDNAGTGIHSQRLNTDISTSEISGNNTLAGSSGRGVSFVDGGTLTVTASTIAENNGPGIFIANGSAAGNISNTTISSNDGVGLSVSNGSATLTNVTVTQNRVTTAGATAGVYAGSGGAITLFNTIVAQNYSGPAGAEVEADLGRATGVPAGSFAVGTSEHNLIGVVGNSGLTTSNNNIILGAGVDAGLAPLADYGGPTRTHALLLSSLAIDNGDDSRAAALEFDQRGEDYDRVVDRNGISEPNLEVDIGAFELALAEIYG